MNSTFTRRSIVAAAVALPAGAKFATRTLAQDADVNAKLKLATDAMAALKSFHFMMETTDGKATILGTLELKGVEGDVVRPASFQATLDASATILDVSVQIVAIDGAVWITNPLQAGSWEQVSTGDEGDGSVTALTNLINPDKLFLLALDLLDSPKIDGQEDLEGIATTRITGEFDPGKLSNLAADETGTPTDLDQIGLLTGEPVDLTFWIADDGKVIRIEEEGPLTESESRDVIRRFTFSEFDAAIEIKTPV